jgi:lysophospholipase L1-like esterase
VTRPRRTPPVTFVLALGVAVSVLVGPGPVAPASGSGNGVAVAVAVAARTARPAAVVAAAVRAPAWGLGDSVMLGSRSLLLAHGFSVNATVSRQFSAAPALVAALARSGHLRRNVVIHLGTNGTISGSDCRAVVRTAGPTRRVFLVTVHARRSWTAQANRAIHACAALFGSRRVVVLDWARLAAAHPSWFGSDGIHPKSAGRRAYTALLVTGVARYGV